ncbi:MAG: glycosyltransferase [Bacteroidales bacterium]|nr:glycosyltransferase [Bacteroidales bacterium]
MAPKVSIVVPIFNAAKTIHRCLDSLKSQTLKEIEIICVNDGSSDNSGTILEDYRSDDRIIIHHQKNEGVSAARNRGVSLATGEYIAFLDADDYADPTTYETLYTAARENVASMVVSDFYRVTVSGLLLENQCAQSGKPELVLDSMFSWSVVVVWNRLIKRDLLFDVSFTEGISLMEDKLYIASILKKMMTCDPYMQVYHVPKALIYYVNDPSTLTLTPRSAERLLPKSLQGLDHLYNLLKDFQPEKTKRQYYTFILEYAFLTYWKRRQTSIPELIFQESLSPYAYGINRYTRPGIRKTITLTAISKGFRAAQKYDWLMAFPIMADRVRHILFT